MASWTWLGIIAAVWILCSVSTMLFVSIVSSRSHDDVYKRGWNAGWKAGRDAYRDEIFGRKT